MNTSSVTFSLSVWKMPPRKYAKDRYHQFVSHASCRVHFFRMKILQKNKNKKEICDKAECDFLLETQETLYIKKTDTYLDIVYARMKMEVVCAHGHTHALVRNSQIKYAWEFVSVGNSPECRRVKSFHETERQREEKHNTSVQAQKKTFTLFCANVLRMGLFFIP